MKDQLVVVSVIAILILAGLGALLILDKLDRQDEDIIEGRASSMLLIVPKQNSEWLYGPTYTRHSYGPSEFYGDESPRPNNFAEGYYADQNELHDHLVIQVYVFNSRSEAKGRFQIDNMTYSQYPDIYKNMSYYYIGIGDESFYVAYPDTNTLNYMTLEARVSNVLIDIEGFVPYRDGIPSINRLLDLTIEQLQKIERTRPDPTWTTRMPGNLLLTMDELPEYRNASFRFGSFFENSTLAYEGLGVDWDGAYRTSMFIELSVSPTSSEAKEMFDALWSESFDGGTTVSGLGDQAIVVHSNEVHETEQWKVREGNTVFLLSFISDFPINNYAREVVDFQLAKIG